MRVSELKIIKPEFGKVKEAKDPAELQSINPVLGQVTMEQTRTLWADLSQNHCNLLLHHVWLDNPDEDQVKDFLKTHTTITLLPPYDVDMAHSMEISGNRGIGLSSDFKWSPQTYVQLWAS